MSSGTEYELILSEAAKRDIKDILRKTGEEWGEQQIAVYEDKLDNALQTIHRHPAIGHPSPRLPKARRAYSVGSHVVFYRVLGMTVRVDRILHKRMNPAKHLLCRSRGSSQKRSTFPCLNAEVTLFSIHMTVTIHLPSDIEAALVAQARAEAWRESANGLPHTPPLSDEAISRESIYGDRSWPIIPVG